MPISNSKLFKVYGYYSLITRGYNIGIRQAKHRNNIERIRLKCRKM